MTGGLEIMKTALALSRGSLRAARSNRRRLQSEVTGFIMERRQHPRVRARIRCELHITPVGWRFNGFTRNLSGGGAEFEAMESLVHPKKAVRPGMLALITFPILRRGATEECQFRCRICYVNANGAGVEFTDTFRTPEQSTALGLMLTTRSNRWD